jgi:hypothetical protein
MKKFSIVLAAATIVLAGTSCKKPRTCTCTDGTYQSTTTVVMTKKKAKEYCDAEQAAYGSGVTCSID